MKTTMKQKDRVKAMQEPKPGKLAQVLAASMFLISCVLVSLLSFISMELALFMVAVIVVGCFFHMIYAKPDEIGYEMLDTIRQIYRKQNKLEEAVSNNTKDIMGIREELENISPNVKANNNMPSDKLLSDIKHNAHECQQGKKFKKPLPDDNKGSNKDSASGNGAKATSWISDIIPAFMRPKKERLSPCNDYIKPEPLSAEILGARKRSKIVARIKDGEVFANEDINESHEDLSDMVVKEYLHNAVQNQTVDVFLQPIVRLPQRHTNYYELFARIRTKPGMYLPAHRYMGLAVEERLMAAIDNILLIKSLKALKNNFATDRVSTYFINIKPSTLRNTVFMDGLLNFISKNKHMASSLVFEISQTDFNRLSEGEKQILDGLSQLYCRFSLDNVTHLPDDVYGLYHKNIRFIKISASRFLGKDNNSANGSNDDSSYNKALKIGRKTKRAAPANSRANNSAKNIDDMLRKKRRLEASGIEVIIDHVENEPELLELLDYDINLGQGYLFGRPDLEGVYQFRKTA